MAPDTAFAWKSGKLIYDRTPLAEVVADLNQAGQPRRIRADPSAASVTVSRRPAGRRGGPPWFGAWNCPPRSSPRRRRGR
ncbi:hypothetical protein ACRAWD_01050 [Caulobacter segnis]